MSDFERFLPNDEYQAAIGAASPSSINVFATMADIATVQAGHVIYDEPSGTPLTQRVKMVFKGEVTAVDSSDITYGDHTLVTVTSDNTPSIQSVASAATVTPTANDDIVIITAQGEALSLINPSGSPVQGQALIIRIKDDGTGRAISYGSEYRIIGTTLPTTTVANKTIYLRLIYNSTDTKWDVISVNEEI